MDTNWIFVSNGILITAGVKKLAKNGVLGVTSEKELYLYNDNGEVIDHAPITQVVAKFSVMVGDSLNINGRKYSLSFVPPPKTSTMILGGAIGAFAEGVANGAANADKTEKRKEFISLIESL